MKVLSNALRYFALPPLNFSRNLSCVHLTPSTSLKCPVSSHTKKLWAQVPTNLFFFAKDSLTLMWVAHQGCECSSLIVAATRVRIPASCQILYVHKVITRDGERTLLDPGNKKSFKKLKEKKNSSFFSIIFVAPGVGPSYSWRDTLWVYMEMFPPPGTRTYVLWCLWQVGYSFSVEAGLNILSSCPSLQSIQLEVPPHCYDQFHY